MMKGRDSTTMDGGIQQRWMEGFNNDGRKGFNSDGRRDSITMKEGIQQR